MASKTPSKAVEPSFPVLQWVMAAIGGVLISGAIGIVVWEAVQPEAPPALSVRLVSVSISPAGQVALVKVVNDGDDTASGVDIEGVLGEETASATVDYVPGHGHAKAFLRFDGDPRSAELSVKGWSAP